MKQILIFTVLFSLGMSVFAQNPGSDATLSSLTVSYGALVPEFSPDVTEYTVNVPYDVTSVTFNATANDEQATIISIPQDEQYELRAGHNDIFQFHCIAEDKETQIMYQVMVERAVQFPEWPNFDPEPDPDVDPDTRAMLSSLTVSHGSLYPDFNPSVREYIVKVPYNVNYVEFNATANDEGATISHYVQDELWANTGGNLFEFLCKAEGKTQVSYRVRVFRAAQDPPPIPDPNVSTDATLSGLTVSYGVLVPDFDPNVREYTVNVPYEVDSFAFNATPKDVATTISYAKQKQLWVGRNPLGVVCKAEDGKTQITYEVDVYRAAPVYEPGYFLSNDSRLKSLTVSPGVLVPDFDPNVREYTVNVADTVKFVAVKGTPNHPRAWVQNFTVQLSNTKPDSRCAMTCTAEDGSTKVYWLTINRATPLRDPMTAIATLSSLTVSHGVLVPEFSPDVTNYTVSVPDTVTFVTFGARPTHDGAAVSSEDGWTHQLNVARIYCLSEDHTRQIKYRVAVNRDIPTSGSEPDPEPAPDSEPDLKASDPTGIDQPAAKPAINLYREAGSSIVIEATDDWIKGVEVFDLSGKILHKSSYSGVLRANWKAAQKGLYLVKIRMQSGNSVYRKMIV
ncbi:MAG: cadherin-like beta sandwich domain-containing protein [Dysgonamonadaceae bacterium]|jgi:hypothetical protein|nr:cadherin-like beta sandwich domain-containing protein [Dysgonamonadaceae bacterium]